MNTVFIGGSRRIARFPDLVRHRLDRIVANDHRVIVGDANGADKAVQKHLLDSGYEQVTVFCSGSHPRNNLGGWPTEHVKPPGKATGFHFYAAKDREMASRADFGLMIWDGRSPGTVLNVLRLTRAGKPSVLINVPDGSTLTVKSASQWDEFLSRCSPELRADLRDRATDQEWQPAAGELQPGLLDEHAHDDPPSAPDQSEGDLADVINGALACGDTARALEALGSLARARGMTQVARQAGMARESLHRSLSSGGSPEFATVLRVMTAVGLRMEVSEAASGPV